MDESTAALVRQMREALHRFLNIVGDSRGVDGYHRNGAIAEWDGFPEVEAAESAIAAADQWLAQQRGPLTDGEITAEAFTGHGYAQGTTGSAMFRRGVRFAEQAHGIGQPAGEDKQ